MEALSVLAINYWLRCRFLFPAVNFTRYCTQWRRWFVNMLEWLGSSKNIPQRTGNVNPMATDLWIKMQTFRWRKSAVSFTFFCPGIIRRIHRDSQRCIRYVFAGLNPTPANPRHAHICDHSETAVPLKQFHLELPAFMLVPIRWAQNNCTLIVLITLRLQSLPPLGYHAVLPSNLENAKPYSKHD